MYVKASSTIIIYSAAGSLLYVSFKLLKSTATLMTQSTRAAQPNIVQTLQVCALNSAGDPESFQSHQAEVQRNVLDYYARDSASLVSI